MDITNGFPAKKDGQCVTCKLPIHTGDMIRWSRKTPGIAWHAGECYTNRPSEDSNPFPPISKPTVSVSTPASGDFLAGMANALAPYLEEKLKAKVDENTVLELIEDSVKQALASTAFVTVNRVEYKACDGQVVDMGIQHKRFALLLQACSVVDAFGYHLNVWLTGPAGSGKTTAAKHVAKALGLPFYATGAISQSFQLLGFMNATGNYVTTDFRRCYENGGVIILDETDASSNEGVLALNQALANGECAFPDKLVPRHKDFVCIAAANTWGLGATNDYVGRAKLDAAFLDRFVSIDWPIDEALETATCGNPTWAKRVQDVRSRARAKGLNVVVSPRASYFGSALLGSGMPQAEVDSLTLRKGMTDDQWNGVK